MSNVRQMFVKLPKQKSANSKRYSDYFGLPFFRMFVKYDNPKLNKGNSKLPQFNKALLNQNLESYKDMFVEE